MNETKNKSSFWPQFLIWASLICMVAAVAVMPNIYRPRATSAANACINNLRQIDAAINEWAVENKKTNGTVVNWNDIKPYIKLNSSGNIPGCPKGGKYTLGKVGDTPQVSCSLSTLTPGDFLP